MSSNTSLIKSFDESGKSLSLYMDVLSNDDCEPLSRDETKELVKEFIEGGRTDMKLREKIIRKNLRIVAHVCKRYTLSKIPYIDLIQEGNVGLLEALDSYDLDEAVSNGKTFPSYVMIHVAKRVLRYIENNQYQIKMPRNNQHQKIFYHLYKYVDIRSGRATEEQIKQIASDLNVDEDNVREMVTYLYVNQYADNEHTSVALSSGEDMSFNIFDTLVSVGQEVDHIVEEDDYIETRREMFNAEMEKLDDTDKYIIQRRYLLEEPESYKIIGKRIGVSGERARQIANKAVDKLTKTLNGKLE